VAERRTGERRRTGIRYLPGAVDNSNPFRILGGLQDNGSWLGPSQTLFEAGSGPTGSGNPGINRATWDMQPDPQHCLPNRGEDQTTYVPAGKYKLTLTSAGKTETSTLEITPYPCNADAPIPPVSKTVRGGKDD